MAEERKLAVLASVTDPVPGGESIVVFALARVPDDLVMEPLDTLTLDFDAADLLRKVLVKRDEA